MFSDLVDFSNGIISTGEDGRKQADVGMKDT
jgi:hypothetical protein